MATAGPTGEETGRLFDHDGELVGLTGEAYEDLIRLCESVYRLNPVQPRISIGVVKDTVLDWVRKTYTQEISIDLFPYALPIWNGLLAMFDIWICVAPVGIGEQGHRS
jgi:hypothetical protein